MSDELPDVQRITAYTLKPDDVLVIETPHGTTQQQVKNLRTRMADAFGPDVAVMVLAGCTLRGVVSKDDKTVLRAVPNPFADL